MNPMRVKRLAGAFHQEQIIVSHNLSLLVRCRFLNFERRGR